MQKTRRIRSSGNILLQRLVPSDQRLLEPHITERLVVRGESVLGAGAPIGAIQFPGTAIFSVVDESAHGRLAEIATVGREGMIGWPALLGCDQASHAAVCQVRGSAWSIPVDAARAACARSNTLRAALLQFVHMIIEQMGRAISSQLQCSLDQRLARWLLMRHDRLGGDILLVHHEEIADQLHVRRASVTDSLHVLEGDLLIRCNRGKILIRNRPALETFAGASYGTVEAHYRSLIAPFGKSLEAAGLQSLHIAPWSHG